MSGKVAVIFGVTGQDGALLSQYLISLNYLVIGVARRCSVSNRERLEKLKLMTNPKFLLLDGDVTDNRSVRLALEKAHKENLPASRPIEVYNLAAMSDVGISFNQPKLCFDVNTNGVLNILEEIISINKMDFKFYQAGTSEQFGSSVDSDGFQREITPFHPRSPYAVSKVAAHHLVQNYREAYGLHASVGILLNHESEYRGDNFLTRKVTKYVGQLYKKIREEEYKLQRELPPSEINKTSRDIIGQSINFKKLQLGNLKSSRDWSYANDMVEGMHLILQQTKPDDYVLASGETHTVEEFIQEAFKVIGINNWRDYIEISSLFIRPSEVDYLRGDSTKARKILGWTPKVDFKHLVRKMVSADAGF